MHEVRTQSVSTLGGRLDIAVNIAGQGDPVVYLHSAGGFYWDDFLDGLADNHTVYAPYFPGTQPGVPDGIEQLDELWDAVLAYDDLLDEAAEAIEAAEVEAEREAFVADTAAGLMWMRCEQGLEYETNIHW